jgi:D-alanyl-lipoteichoic acid acyltransferase DltB (MBOAT superfamily)
VDQVYGDPRRFGGFDIALAMIDFSFQAYADFAGYSLIAIGRPHPRGGAAPEFRP